LLDKEAGKVLRVKGVADLQAVTAEAEVAQGALFAPGVDPVGDDALIWAAKLAGAGEDAAAVDPDREPESGVVFSCSEQSLLEPYSESGAWVEKVSVMPMSATPG
jgi:hypothetical protein